MSIEAMKQALEALESYHGYMEPLTTVFGGPRVPVEQSTTGKVERAITSLHQAIATEESSATQEQIIKNYPEKDNSKREWVWLTDEEIDELYGSPMELEPSGSLGWVRIIEAKLKEKNT